jgi:hypothetical protein
VGVAEVFRLVIPKREVTLPSVIDDLPQLCLTVPVIVTAPWIRMKFLAVVGGVGRLLVAHADLMSAQMSLEIVHFSSHLLEVCGVAMISHRLLKEPNSQSVRQSDQWGGGGTCATDL